MGAWEIIVGSLVLLMSVIMIIVIIFQEGHDAGLGTITGGADSFMKRGKAKTADAMFAKITKFCAIAFFLFVVILNSISLFGKKGNEEKKDFPGTETSQVSVETSEEASASEESTETSDEVSGDTSGEASKTAENSKAESSAPAETSQTSETSAPAETSQTSETSAPADTSQTSETSESAASQESA